MVRWWAGNTTERYWVEIRWAPGIGIALRCPDISNPWYDLLLEVAQGDVVYHWHAEEHRFVGRSLVDAPCSIQNGERVVPLTGFEIIAVPIGLQDIRAREDLVYDVRRALQAAHPGERLYLPFQFRSDGLRFVSNYFAKLPAALIEPLFGLSGVAREAAAPPFEEDGPDRPPDTKFLQITYLQPFRAKADTDYVARIQGGTRRHGRHHETLVNDFAEWLATRGLTVGRNAAIDIGIGDPPVIVEAKVVVGSWPAVIRQAVGQLYEYRYFQVADPNAELVFLASRPVPKEWVEYLQYDREIAVAWRDGTAWHVSKQARRALGL